MTQNQIAYHNVKELQRHNMATEAENTRHARVSEALDKWGKAISNYQVAVNNLHYTRMDAETERANKARESQNLLSLNETMRSNLANEDIRRRTNDISSAANAIQRMQAQETSRHNKALETIQDTLNASVITKNEAETSYTGANTKYIQERTNTQRAETSKAWAQESNFRADTNLKYVQTNTEYTKQYLNVLSGVKQGSDAITGLLRVIVPTGSASSGSDMSQTFWTQMEKQLK